MFKRKGFTLIELMLALTILGILTALVLPMLNNNSPSRNRMMMKKAYYTIEDVVSNLINDESLYPEIGVNGTYVGFDNLENTCGTDTCSSYNKFPKLFVKQLNVDGDVSYSGSGTSRTATFRTSDGMNWTVQGGQVLVIPNVITDVEPDAKKIVQTITVDVNGDKKPNCVEGENGCDGGDFKDIDRFKVYVTARGKIVPAANQSWFEDAISIDSSVNGD